MPGFNDIIGQDQIKEYFQRAIRQHNISHAYILTGEPGMGRKTMANAFAMTLLCESGEERPCSTCHSCRQFLTGNHPDVIRVHHEKPNSIGVDDVRDQIVNDVQIKPYSSQYKIYMVDEAEKMTVQAQNALLKTIEEPPSYAIIIFITANAEGFLPTILSRCITLKLKPLYDKVIQEYLEKNLQIDKTQAGICTSFARGNLGKAIRLASSEEFMTMRQEITALLKQVYRMSVLDMLETLKHIKDSGIDIRTCIDFMKLWYRDVLMFKATCDMNLLIFSDEFKSINEIANKSSFAGIEKILEGMDKAKVRLDANVNFDLTMELMLLTIKEN